MRVSFMPWADLKNELKIGPVTFWPFYVMKETRIEDPKTREHLERYFRTYVDHQGQPVKSVTMCFHDAGAFDDLSTFAFAQLMATVDILAFVAISYGTRHAVCHSNPGFGPPSAERYELVTQYFQPGEDGISVRAGRNVSGGWTIGKIMFPQPWCLGGLSSALDSSLLEGCSKMFPSSFPEETRQRICRSLEWFRMAHVEADSLSELSRLVMLGTGFEILLDMPQAADKSGWFADELGRRCVNACASVETRKDAKGKDVSRTNLAWWGWDFYKLRNKIVHGDQIDSDLLLYSRSGKAVLPQRMVASLVFWECLTRELYTLGCLGDEARACSADWDARFPDEPQGSAESVLANWFLGYDEMHGALGWSIESKAAGDSEVQHDDR